MQLQHYIWLIWRRLWLIFLGVALCSGATYAISHRAAPVYEASALIQVTAPGVNNGNDVFSNQALAVSDALLITSDAVLHAAAKTLPGVTFAQLQKAVSASPADNTELIQVRGDASTPDLAAAITNTVSTIFIQQEITTEVTRLQGTADQLAQQLVTIKTNVDQAQTKLTLLQANNASADQIGQQTNLLNTYQLNYSSTLTNYNNIEFQKATMARSLTIVQPASPPAQPLGSRTTLNTGIAAALSLLLMIVLVLLLDWADATLKTPEDVAHLAQLEPLGSIPLRRDKPDSEAVSDLSLSDAQLERAFAIITTNFNALNTGQRSLLVTSLHAHDGKTTVASHLATTLAQSGTRVLLVDAHINQPTLHKIFNLPNTRGLATSQADVHMLQKQPDQGYSWLSQWATTEPNLWLLPAGTVKGNTTTLLRSPELRKLVAWLLQEQETASNHKLSSPVDIIIFDTPALDVGADTVILAPLCDSTILVIEAGKERKEALQKAQATLKRLGTPIIGVVVNRQKASHRSYLYIRQPQQGAFPEATTPAIPGVKYPLLKMPPLAMRAFSKNSVANSASHEKDDVTDGRIKTVKQTTGKPEVIKEPKLNGDTLIQPPLAREGDTQIRPPLAREGDTQIRLPLARNGVVPAQGKFQGGNQA